MAATDLNINDIAEALIIYNVDAQVCINTFHYQFTTAGGAGSFSTALQFATAFAAVGWDDGAGGGISYVMSTGVNNIDIHGQKIAPVRAVAANFVPATQTGQVASTPEPSGACACMKRLSALAGRKNRGRIYVGGIPVSMVTASKLNATFTLTANGAFTFMSQTLSVPGSAGANTFTPIIYNLRAPANKQNVTDWSWDSPVRYQRRREVGRGI